MASLDIYAKTTQKDDLYWNETDYEWGINLHGFSDVFFDMRVYENQVGDRKVFTDSSFFALSYWDTTGTLIGSDSGNESDWLSVWGNSQVNVYTGKGADTINLNDFPEASGERLVANILDFSLEDTIRLSWGNGYGRDNSIGSDAIFEVENNLTRSFNQSLNQTSFVLKHREEDRYANFTLPGNIELDYASWDDNTVLTFKLFDGSEAPSPAPAPEPSPTPAPSPIPDPDPEPVVEGTEIGTDQPDQLFGTDEVDVIQALAGNDLIFGSREDDFLNGGDGRDTVQYSGIRKHDVSFSKSNSVITISSDEFGSDKLTGIERIRLDDGWYALDISGNAGNAGKIIVAAFGADLLPEYFSVGLGLADSGLGLHDLASLVMSTGLVTTDHEDFLETVFDNLLDRPPNSFEEAVYLGYLENNLYSHSDLLVMGANTSYAETFLLEFAQDYVAMPYDPGLV